MEAWETVERPDSGGAGLVCVCERNVSGKASFSKFVRFSRTGKKQNHFHKGQVGTQPEVKTRSHHHQLETEATGIDPEGLRNAHVRSVTITGYTPASVGAKSPQFMDRASLKLGAIITEPK